ncbi:MAG TPA: tetratricopeptide repeat protein, partial [Streptomyces sp.]
MGGLVVSVCQDQQHQLSSSDSASRPTSGRSAREMNVRSSPSGTGSAGREGAREVDELLLAVLAAVLFLALLAVLLLFLRLLGLRLVLERVDPVVDRGDLHLQLLDHPEQLEPQLLDAVADRAQGLRDTTQFGKPAEALPHLNRSLVLTGEIGDTLGQAGVHFVPALHWTHEKDDERALGHANSALELYRALGDPKWEARAFAMIGACHSRLGRHGKARTHAEAGLALCRERQDV